MSERPNELTYLVKYQNDDASYNARLKDIERLQKGRSKKGGSKEADEIKELQIELDKLSREYLKNSKSLAELRRQTDGYKAQLSELNAVKKKAGELTDEQAEQEAAIRTALKDTNADYRAQERELIANQVAIEATNGSYNDLQARLKQLDHQLKSLPNAWGENAQQVDSLQKEYNALNTRLKDFDATMGNHQRNVGDYTNSIRAAANAVAVFQGPLGPLAGRLNSAATTLNRMSAGFRSSAIGATLLGRAISMALVVSGIGALIAIGGALFQFFTKSEEGQQKLRVITAALGAAFSVLTDRAIVLGKAIVEAISEPSKLIERVGERFSWLRDAVVAAFEDPQEAVLNLWEIIKTNIMNRVQGFIDTFGHLGRAIQAAFKLDFDTFAEEAKGAGNKILQTITGIEDAGFKAAEQIQRVAKSVLDPIREMTREATKRANEAIGLQNRMNALLVKEREFLVRRAEQNKDMAEAREKARNMDIDAQTRLENLLKVRASEKQLLDEELALEQERLKIMQAQLDMSTSKEEEHRAVAEQQAKIFQMEEEHAKKMMSFTRDQVAIERQIRERAVREERFKFEMMQANRQLNLDREVADLEIRGRRFEAETRRLNDALANEEALKNERIAVLTAEFRNQQFGIEEAARMAKEQAEIESEQRIFDAKKRLAEMEVDMRKGMIQSISNLIGASNEAIFGNSKALAVAQAIINTYQGVTAALTMPGPQRWVEAAAVFAAGIANVRKILSTKIGDTAAEDTTQSVSRPNFGLVDTGTNNEALASGMAGMFGGGQQTNTTFIFEGEFDPEFVSIKARQGAESISGRSIRVGL